MKTRQLLKYGNSRILYYGENREECIFSAKKFFFPIGDFFLPSIEIFPPDPALAVVSFFSKTGLLCNTFALTFFYAMPAMVQSLQLVPTHYKILW